jgi:DNA-binding response OmpR family regulator
MGTIMVIEDDLTELTMYKKKLTEAGFTVSTEYDGQKALDRIMKEKPDVLLLDMGLPHISGIDIMKEIRQNTWGISLPIIVRTQHVCTDDMINEILQYNPSFYVIKAQTAPDDVVEKVKKILTV